MLGHEPQWVALYTSPRAEKKIMDSLNEKYGNRSNFDGFEAYVPLQRKLRKWSDRSKWIETPILPSYVFVRTQLRWLTQIVQEQGVVMAVRFGRTQADTAVIREQEIAALRQLVKTEQEIAIMNTHQLKLGRKVRILSGSCEGLEGKIVEDCKDGNFTINIEGLNVSLVITVEQEMLEPIQEVKKTHHKEYHF